MHEKRQPVAPTYLLFVFLSVRPSIRPSNRMQRVRQGLAFFTRTHGAPFGYMLMPAAFRDTIQFSSLTSADLRYPVPPSESARGRSIVDDGSGDGSFRHVVRTIDPSHRRRCRLRRNGNLYDLLRRALPPKSFPRLRLSGTRYFPNSRGRTRRLFFSFPVLASLESTEDPWKKNR